MQTRYPQGDVAFCGASSVATLFANVKTNWSDKIESAFECSHDLFGSEIGLPCSDEIKCIQLF